MKLNALLTTVLSGLGVDPNSTEAQALLGNANLASIDVADELSNKLKGPFFTKEAALASPEIRSVIKAETLNGIDSQLDEVMKAHLDDETLAELKKEGKTMKRLSAYSEKIKELEAKKAGASGKTQSELTKQIDKLNEEKANLINQHSADKQKWEQARKMDKINWEHDSFYSGLEYTLPKEMDKSLKVEAAKAVINKKMKEKDLRFEASESGVEILTKDGTKYYEGNTLITHQDFIKKTLMEAKLLQVSDTQTQTQQTHRGSTGGSQRQHMASNFQEELNKRIAESKIG